MPDRGKKRPISQSYAAITVILIYFLFAMGRVHLCVKSSRLMTFKIARSVPNSARVETVQNQQNRDTTPTIARVIPLTRQERGRRLLPHVASLRSRQESEIAPATKPGQTITVTSPRTTSEVEILPPVFDGCWSGSVAKLDSIHLLHPPQITLWVTKTYRLCYQRDANGSSEPTLTEAGLNSEIASRIGTKVGNVIGQLKVMSTDLRTKAQMRAFLRFDEGPTNPHSFRFPSRLVDELTALECQIDGGTMHVEAQVYGEYDSTPWFAASWHADFYHLPD